MRINRAIRESLRGYAAPRYGYNGDVTIGAKVLVGLLDDISDLRQTLLVLAQDVRRERPADWTPEEADERIAQLLERLSEQINN